MIRTNNRRNSFLGFDLAAARRDTSGSINIYAVINTIIGIIININIIVIINDNINIIIINICIHTNININASFGAGRARKY